MTAKQYFGKYRGIVVDNADPLKRARIKVQVPTVSGTYPTTWCEPCLPLAGNQVSAFFVPQKGAGVWIEFEEGDIDRPIWTGCFWGSMGDLPDEAYAGQPDSPNIVLQTAGKNTLVISDATGILLQSKNETTSVTISDSAGITLVSGTSKISMQPGNVSITNGTATITLGGGPAVTVTNGAGATITLNGPSVAVNTDALVVT
jgi:uncharacterized protein involved in type VI secretion and phage assembly